MSKEKLNCREFLDAWERKNNPFYPRSMRWGRADLLQLLQDAHSYTRHTGPIGKGIEAILPGDGLISDQIEFPEPGM